MPISVICVYSPLYSITEISGNFFSNLNSFCATATVEPRESLGAGQAIVEPLEGLYSELTAKQENEEKET